MSSPSALLWRVFPWDRNASEGERFSAGWIPRTQGKGRFDLPGVPAGVICLAESAEHAVAEMIQHYRGQLLDESDLLIAGRPLSLVAVTLPPDIAGRLADLCDPAELGRLGIRPDQTASGDRVRTQRIAAAIHAAGHSGLRWWSAFLGDWHTATLFRDRLDRPLEFGTPEPLTLGSAAALEAMRTLGIAAQRRRRSE